MQCAASSGDVLSQALRTKVSGSEVCQKRRPSEQSRSLGAFSGHYNMQCSAYITGEITGRWQTDPLLRAAESWFGPR
jgi:hypothetical protein